ncbi:MAG: B12-binding domain-containing radical SAM protein [Planctomycetes bacterium]|nr:B12-binding domain-containing radical SAM protein [Planctomycetota bacterium]
MKKPLILFVNLNPRPEWKKEKTLIYFNIGLCQVATHVENLGYEFDILDFSVNPMTRSAFSEAIQKRPYDIVACGGMLHTLWQISEITDLVKAIRPDIKVIIGGYSTMLSDNKALEWTQADAAIRGEGEYAFEDVLKCIEKGDSFKGIPGVSYRENDVLYHAEVRKPDTNLDTKGIPNWNLFDVESYVKSGQNMQNHHLGSLSHHRFFPIVTTRGCPFACTFCSNTKVIRDNNPYRTHSPEFVADMILKLYHEYDINHFKFVDELSFLNVSYVRKMAKAIKELKIDATYEAICRVGLFAEKDYEIVADLKLAGFNRLFYSIESGSPRILQLMKKRIDLDGFLTQKKLLDRAGIKSSTNVIVGYPTETEEDIKMTFDICLEAGILPSVCFLLPIPGSEMYDYAMEHGYIKNEKEYVFDIGEQQYLKVNLTDIPNDELQEMTLKHLKRVRDGLGMDIPDANLIRSVNIDPGCPSGKKSLFLPEF